MKRWFSEFLCLIAILAVIYGARVVYESQNGLYEKFEIERPKNGVCDGPQCLTIKKPIDETGVSVEESELDDDLQCE